MIGWRMAGRCLALALLVGPAAGGSSAVVDSGSLKSKALADLTSRGGVALAGFAWDGEARPFAAETDAAQVTAPKAGDLSFTILGKGAASVCEGLQRLGSKDGGLKKARLTFKAAEGAATSFKVEGLTVERADCAAKPWTAGLAAAKVTAVAPGKGGDKATKASKKSGAARLDLVAPAG